MGLQTQPQQHLWVSRHTRSRALWVSRNTYSSTLRVARNSHNRVIWHQELGTSTSGARFLFPTVLSGPSVSSQEQEEQRERNDWKIANPVTCATPQLQKLGSGSHLPLPIHDPSCWILTGYPNLKVHKTSITIVTLYSGNDHNSSAGQEDELPPHWEPQ